MTPGIIRTRQSYPASGQGNQRNRATKAKKSGATKALKAIRELGFYSKQVNGRQALVLQSNQMYNQTHFLAVQRTDQCGDLDKSYNPWV